MNNTVAPLRREILTGLALLLPLVTVADFELPDTNYLLIDDRRNPERSRLLVLDGNSSWTEHVPIESSDESSLERQRALSRTRSEDPRFRVRGLTELAGDESDAALNTAIGLLFDPSAAVREEALHLIAEHPGADVEFAIAIGATDPDSDVRTAAADLASWQSEED